MSSIVIKGNTSGQIELAAPDVAGSTTLTMPTTDGTVITNNSAVGDLPKGPAFRASMLNDLSFSVSTWTKVQFDTEEFDTNSNYDNATNYRFTPTVAGYYQVNASARINYSGAAGDFIWVRIYKNGSAYNGHYNRDANGQPYGSVNISDLIYINGSTDYIEVYVLTNHSTATISNGIETKFSAFLARGA